MRSIDPATLRAMRDVRGLTGQPRGEMIGLFEVRIGDRVKLADGRRMKIVDVGAQLGAPGDDVRRARIVIRGWTCTASGRLLGEGWAYVDAIVDRSG